AELFFDQVKVPTSQRLGNEGQGFAYLMQELPRERLSISMMALDLSQSGTLTRVVSFIGAGAIMLVIAYLAPLPPAQSNKESIE
uniref:DUF2339 domain-containing protein n=1 Tax=Acinetobacter ursingii TaxID=108980 RepID=UPI001C09D7FD